jgi:hypothetical protein
MRLELSELNSMLDNGLDVYKHFMGARFDLHKKHLSPLRDEKDPSFKIYWNDKGNAWHYSDFGIAGRNYEGNHWQFLIEKLNTDFKGAIDYVKKQILCIEDGPLYIKMDPKVFEVKHTQAKTKTTRIHRQKVREWTDADLIWWNGFRVFQSTMGLFHVHPVSEFTIHKEESDGLSKEITVQERRGDPIYWIYFPDTGRSKMYRPLSPNKKFKWTSDTNAKEDVFGLHLMPKQAEKGFLLAGNKDTMSFWQNIAYPLGYACCALNAEGTPMFTELFSILKTVTTKWYSIYDNEPDQVKIDPRTGTERIINVGKQSMQKMKEDWGIIPCNQILVDCKTKDVAAMIGKVHLLRGEAGMEKLRTYFYNL